MIEHVMNNAFMTPDGSSRGRPPPADLAGATPQAPEGKGA